MHDRAPDGSTDPSTEVTPERRRRPRESGAFMPAVGRARLLARLSHHYPSLRPNGWYKVIGANPQALEPRARPGYLWIQIDGARDTSGPATSRSSSPAIDAGRIRNFP